MTAALAAMFMTVVSPCLHKPGPLPACGPVRVHATRLAAVVIDVRDPGLGHDRLGDLTGPSLSPYESHAHTLELRTSRK
jgi:hypothetical protein